MHSNEVLSYFQDHFGKAEVMVRVPGRANIIGEHTDYNEGLVLPFAIDKYLFFCASKNGKSHHEIHALNTGEKAILKKEDSSTDGWKRFFSAVFTGIDKEIPGMNIVFGGNLPAGAGLSSSSAIVCGTLFLINELNELQWSKTDMTAMAYRIESGSGVDGGMMDQTAILQSLEQHALYLDCRNKKTQHIPLEMKDHTFYLIHSGVTHNLIETKYNTRRRECKNILKSLHEIGAIYESLRDLEAEDLPDLKQILSADHYKRISYVIKENQRVEQAVKAIQNNDFSTLGSLMYQTHKGLRYDYEVSCTELNKLVDITKEIPEILGSRMMGGGFGGCTLNLLKGKMSENISQKISDSFEKEFGHKPEIWEIVSVNGIQRINETKE